MSGKLFALAIWGIMGAALTAAAFSPIAEGNADGLAGLAVLCLLLGAVIAFFGLVHDSGE